MGSQQRKSVELARTLQRQLEGVAQAGEVAGTAGEGVVSSGCQGLDRLLPQGGFPRGNLVEWLQDGEGGGGSLLALCAAREAARQGGVIVIADAWPEGRTHRLAFFPPAAAAWGVPVGQLVLLRCRTAQEEIWAVDQALRCPAVAAVWAPLALWEAQLDARCFRRWQLAAEQGGSLGLLVRPRAVERQPCWATTRWLVIPQGPPAGPPAGPQVARQNAPVARQNAPVASQNAQILPRSKPHSAPCEAVEAAAEHWDLEVRLLRCRGRAGGQSLHVRIDPATGSLQELPCDTPQPGGRVA